MLNFVFQSENVVVPDNLVVANEALDICSIIDKRLIMDTCLIPPPGNRPDSAEASASAEATASAVMLRPEAVLPEGLSTVPVRVCFAERPDGASLLRAFHIMQWRADSRFCGSCGHQNGDSTTELARLCPNCGRIEYPRICPAIIVMINRTTERGEEILLAHNKRFKNNMYSLIAGFNEAGESLEETVAREIREEVGVEVKDVRYLTSQSWPFPASLMLGFRARWASGEARPDGVEIGDARWFTRQNVPALPRNGSVAYRIISGWLGHSPEA